MSPKILYIDDECDLLNLAASFFEEENLPIDTCSTFSEALEKIRSGKYDLIISDAKMPNGSGKELLEIIKAENLNCKKFILITGNPDFDDSSGDDNYDMILFKPFNFVELINKARAMLEV